MSEKIIDAAIVLKAELLEEGVTSDVFEEIIEVIKERSQRLGE